MKKTPTPADLPAAPRELWLALRHAAGLSTRELGKLAGKQGTTVMRATPAEMWDMLPDADKAAQEAAARAYLNGERVPALVTPQEAQAAAQEVANAIKEAAPEPTPEERKAAAKAKRVAQTAKAREAALALRAEQKAAADRAPVFGDNAALENAGWHNLTKGRKPSGLVTIRQRMTGKSSDITAVEQFLAQFGPKASKVAGLILTEARAQRRKAPQRHLDPLFPRPDRERVAYAVAPDVAEGMNDYLSDHGPDLGRALLALLYAEATNPSRTPAEYLAAVTRKHKRSA